MMTWFVLVRAFGLVRTANARATATTAGLLLAALRQAKANEEDDK